MFPIRFKRPALLCMAMLTVVLSGCGLIQKVVDESKSVASAVFYKQIKILHSRFLLPQRPEYGCGRYAAFHDGACLATENPRRF